MSKTTVLPPSTNKEWYVEQVRGLGWAVKAMTFIDTQNQDDSVVFFASELAPCTEVVQAHNAHPYVVANKAHVLKEAGE